MYDNSKKSETSWQSNRGTCFSRQILGSSTPLISGENVCIRKERRILHRNQSKSIGQQKRGEYQNLQPQAKRLNAKAPEIEKKSKQTLDQTAKDALNNTESITPQETPKDYQQEVTTKSGRVSRQPAYIAENYVP